VFTAYRNALGRASDATLSIMGILVIIGICYKLTEHYGGEAIYGGVVAVASFLILTPHDFEGVSGGIPTAILGAEGMFLGIFTAFMSAELYRLFVNKERMIKMRAGVRRAVAKSLSALIPVTVTLTVFLLISKKFS